MKTSITLNIRIFFIFITVLLFSSFNNIKKPFKTPTYQQKDVELLRYNYPESYSNLWKEITALEEKRLYRTALQKVLSIKQKSLNTENVPQVVKCYSYISKYSTYLHFDSKEYIPKIISEIDSLTTFSRFPLTPILHYVKSQFLIDFYHFNRFFLHFKKKTTYRSHLQEDDIIAWDITTLLSEIQKEILLSLQEKDSLQRTVLEDFNSMLTRYDESRFVQSSLYDLFAFNAIDHFKNTEFNLNKPADFFTINQPEYFSPPQTFIHTKIPATDTTSTLYHILKIYQNLSYAKINDEQSSAFLYLERLKFVYNNSLHPQKEHLYLTGLLQLIELYPQQQPYTALTRYEIALHHYKQSLKYTLADTTYRWERKKALDICDNTIKLYHPRNKGVIACKTLKRTITKNIEIEIETESSYFTSSPIRSVTTYQNISQLYFRLIPVPLLTNVTYDNFYSSIMTHQAIKEWDEKLDNFNDYQKHKKNILISKGLPSGRYFIVASPDSSFQRSNFITYQSFTVSEMSYSFRANKDNSIIVQVVNSESGKPIPDVTIYNLSSPEKIYRTDKKGLSNIKTLAPNKRNKLIISKGTDTIVATISPHFRNDTKSTYIQTYFFTDRTIFRPGQTVFFKGIVVKHNPDNNHQIVANQPQTVILNDANQKEIARLQVITNEFGTFHGSFSLPETTRNGHFSISTSKKGKSRKYFLVEKYKRPKFEVLFTSITASCEDNAPVTASGKATAFSNYPISNSTVKYHVIKTFYYPFPFKLTSPTTEIISGITYTDNEGNFSFDFKPTHDDETTHARGYDYKITVDITDINGETQSATRHIKSGLHSLFLSVEAPRYINTNDRNNSVIIKTSNINGKNIPKQGKITISQLVEPKQLYRNSLLSSPDIKTFTSTEFHRLFPYDDYNSESNILNFKKKKTLKPIPFNTANSNNVTIPKLAPGRYLLEASTTDKCGNIIIDTTYFTVFDDNARKISTYQTWWTHTPKTTALPGDTIYFLVGTAEKELFITYEIELKGKVIHSEFLALHNEQKKISIPIKDEYRGNFSIILFTTKHNRFIHRQTLINVPYTNKELDISLQTFRNKLYPEKKEKWNIKITDKNNNIIPAEFLATLYDASLDNFKPNTFELPLYHKRTSYNLWKNYFFHRNSSRFAKNMATHYSPYYSYQPKFSRIKWTIMQAPMIVYSSRAIKPAKTSYPPIANKTKEPATNKKSPPTQPIQIIPRKNFNETAFFFPDLRTDSSGNISIEFTAPESISRWKFLAIAHTKDLKTGSISKNVTTQKELMVIPNLPRFFRATDTVELSCKIVNLSSKKLSGNVHIELFDASTNEHLLKGGLLSYPFNVFMIDSATSTSSTWKVAIPKGVKSITCRITAQTPNHSDGEEHNIPVLSDRILVTESLPLHINKQETKNFVFPTLTSMNNKSETMKLHRLTFEYTPNPFWYAILALPYIKASQHESAEQLSSRYYTNSITAHIINSTPEIKQTFELWQKQSPDIFLSNLEQNNFLKSTTLNETPWVTKAQKERTQRKNISLLFDKKHLHNEQQEILKQLKELQFENGAWGNFKNKRPSRLATQNIMTEIGYLNHLGVIDLSDFTFVKKAFDYLEYEMEQDFLKATNPELDTIRRHIYYETIITYLYARSLFPSSFNQKTPAFIHFYNYTIDHWKNYALSLQVKIALTAFRNGDVTIAKEIMSSFQELVFNKEEATSSNIKFITLLIEAFAEVMNDSTKVELLKTQLLKLKQTSPWGTDKNTAEACYALLLRGNNHLLHTKTPQITIGNTKINPVKQRAGTGYFSTSWYSDKIIPKMGNISVTQENALLSWGALYLQYYENINNISSYSTDAIKLSKTYYLVKNTPYGQSLSPITSNSNVKTGDKIVVRLTLAIDRTMQYLHIKDARISGFEPVSMISQYKKQSGVSHYETTKDISTDFFIPRLNQGKYIFEYELIATQKGIFNTGISTVQSLYAPCFSAHSKNFVIRVK